MSITNILPAQAYIQARGMQKTVSENQPLLMKLIKDLPLILSISGVATVLFMSTHSPILFLLGITTVTYLSYAFFENRIAAQEEKTLNSYQNLKVLMKDDKEFSDLIFKISKKDFRTHYVNLRNEDSITAIKAFLVMSGIGVLGAIYLLVQMKRLLH